MLNKYTDLTVTYSGGNKTEVLDGSTIHNWLNVNKDMEVMFTLFRKYRCGVSIALQNLSQLSKGDKSGYYRQTVLANTKTQIVFGDTVPEDSKK